MKNDVFITDDFLLETKAARRLYHEFAAGMPILDYHCHLPTKQIAADQRWENIAQVWLRGDHYKWRALRANGVDERHCTGNASDWEKFEKWAETLPCLLRNPLYTWSHLELARYFGITDRLLGPDTARSIWNDCNKRMARRDFSARGLMTMSNVVLVCTTDDPVDSLEHHRAVAKDRSFKVQVLPTWRPDAAMAVENLAVFNAWVETLAEAADVDIRDYDSFLGALRTRHDFFHAAGCRLSDHGLDTAYAEAYTEPELKAIFRKARLRRPFTPEEVLKFKSAMLYEFGIMDHAKGWTQQFHFGPIRNNSTRQFAALGPDSGFDSMGDFTLAKPLSRLLDRLDSTNQLAKTILYCINPKDGPMLAAMAGNFQDGSIPGKIQYGSGWWFLDQRDGMERQLEDLSQIGVLSRFVGMLTDSRSFLSYPRHEYFRRVLCNLLGSEMDRGLIPTDFKWVGSMVQDISYRNAATYFGFDVPK